jgi:two-component system sensor histidine kinase/response regulator
MINDILDISKIEAGRFELNIQTFDLRKLLGEMNDMIHLRTQEKKLNFRLEIAPDTPQYVKADNSKLRQILINLLSNAIKFTEEGGIILRMNFRAMPTDGMIMLHIEIVDSGAGIEKEKLGDLFQPFVQLNPANSDGSGLGLVISKSLVELMEGRITVSSVLGVGSTFEIELPVFIAKTDDITVKEDWNPIKCLAPQQPVWRLLVVDDNADNRLLLFKILTEVGFQIREASNGAEAISVFQEWQPHLIWMDMHMPMMNGYEATEKIRQLAGGDQVKIIALTASAFEEEHQKIVAAGCDAILHKPFHAPELFATLMSCLKVKFIYRDIPNVQVSPKQEITPEMLARLPMNLRQQLHDAASRLDMEETELVINQIHHASADIAEVLYRLEQQYQFDQIIKLLNCANHF